MTATRKPIRQRRKRNLPDPLSCASNVPEEDDQAERQAIMQLESVRAFVEQLRISEEHSESGPDESDAARQAIHEDPLSVEVRSGWQPVGQTFQPEEYRIVLCTGGQHVEIHGYLDHYKTPADAIIRYQDWFTRFRELPMTADDNGYALEYARQFYYGE